jgi:hypothetical protein
MEVKLIPVNLPDPVENLELCAGYLGVPQELKPIFTNEFLAKPGILPKKEEIPVYLFPSHHYENLTYCLLQLFPDSTVLHLDAHLDASPLQFPTECDWDRPERMEKKHGEGMIPEMEILQIKQRGISLEEIYRKSFSTVMACYNFILDVLEDKLVQEYWLITKPENKAGLFKIQVNKVFGKHDTYSYKISRVSMGSVIGLTKIVVDSSKRVFVHYDPDIHPPNVLKTDYEGQANVSLEEMKSSLRYIHDKGKLAAITVFTQNPLVVNNIKEALYCV